MKANKIISINLPILATLVMAMAFTFSCSGDNDDDGGGGGSCSLDALDGVWDYEGGKITISGSAGVFSALPPNSGTPFKVGDQIYKGLTSTGNLTWSGQALGILEECDDNDNCVVTGTQWNDVLLTMSADGQTLTIGFYDYGYTMTHTRKCNNLSGGGSTFNSSSSNEQSSSSGIDWTCCSCYLDPYGCPDVCLPIVLNDCPIPHPHPSSSSGIPDCCPDIECFECGSGSCIARYSDKCIPPVLVGNEYVCPMLPPTGNICEPNNSSSSVKSQSSSSVATSSSSSGIPHMCCPPPNCDDYGGNCPPICEPPVLVGNVYVCAVTNKSSSSGYPLCYDEPLNPDCIQENPK